MEPKKTTSDCYTTAPLDAKRLADLGKVLFNSHIDVTARFVLGVPSECIESWPACAEKHFRQPLVVDKRRSAVRNLEDSLSSDRYSLFLVQINSFIQRCEWPTESILNQIIEHILKINPDVGAHLDNAQVYLDLCVVFSEIVERFPPCWLAVRPSYYEFFKSPIAAFSNHSKPLTRKAGLIADWLELLDATLAMTDAQNPDCSIFNKGTNYDRAYLGLQSFGALKRATRLERLFLVLQLFVNVLERDLSTWAMYTPTDKNPSKFLFNEKHTPLVVAAFGLTADRQNTATVRKTFELFTRAFDGGIDPDQLKLLERLISSMMLAVNMFDQKTMVPQLGATTRNLIIDFFNIFQTHQGSYGGRYDDLSRMLRIPLVRYEFIHNVLRVSKFSPKGAFSPSKVFDELFVKKGWLKLKPQVDMADRANGLSRERYLKMLLLALKAYCTFYGLKPFNACLKHGSITNRVIKFGNKIHERVSHDDNESHVVLVPNKAQFLNMEDVHLSKEALKKYEEDLKYISLLHERLPEKYPNHIDALFKDWMMFFVDFHSIP